MIISVSRRTDVAAFYSEWFMNRVREGWCLVPNPFNRAQVSRVSLLPGDVDAFIFWTRNPAPLMPHLSELDERGFNYCFLITLIGYPASIDPGSPPVDRAIRNFQKLAERIGPERITWRYDPIILSEVSGHAFHEWNFRRLSGELSGAASRCVISFVKVYRKARKRLESAIPGGPVPADPQQAETHRLLVSISEMAREGGMRLFGCASETDLSGAGIPPGKCIDAGLLSNLFGTSIESRKDPSQRPECGCSASRDIGAYDTCLYGCSYCYATSSIERARANHAAHDPRSPSLI